MKNRIIKNHSSRIYRNKDPNKAFYIAMDEPGAKTMFVCLAKYKVKVPTVQVLLAEAVCCCLFGTYDSEQYRIMRPKELPVVEWGHGLNRSDPLRTLPRGPQSIGNDATTCRRLRTLENCRQSGPMRVGFSS